LCTNAAAAEEDGLHSHSNPSYPIDSIAVRKMPEGNDGTYVNFRLKIVSVKFWIHSAAARLA
jgi:hypothetical protein